MSSAVPSGPGDLSTNKDYFNGYGPRVLVDTGFLVALVDRNDACHAWAIAVAKGMPGPWLTCEACISESFHLLGQIAPTESLKILARLECGALVSQHLITEQLAAVQAEAERYHGRPVDKADFAVYRRGRRARRLMTPA